MKAIVTGASSGIGKEMAIYLSDLGYDLVLVANDKTMLEEVGKLMKTNFEIVDLDLTIESNVFKLYDLYKNDKIEILVNNAGFGLFGNFIENDLETQLAMIDLNVKAYHILTYLFLKKFIIKNHGYILNVCSSAGFLAGPGLSTYYATKNYTTKLTMAIYEELKHNHLAIHISALCPGPVKTNFTKNAGGYFTVKEMKVEYVARYGINQMFKGKMIIIPGIKMKLTLLLSRIIPYKLQLKITHKIQRKKRKGF